MPCRQTQVPARWGLPLALWRAIIGGMADVLTLTPQGLYCPAGDFHVDPWGAVPRALITHAHSDHARTGMGAYLASDIAAPVLRQRLGPITLDTLAYGQTRTIGGAQVSFHPAGHVPGSAQIRVAVGGQVWVVSGDYKTTPDGLSTPFAPVRCHTFITECTFGLPLFRWRAESVLAAELNAWWAANAAEGRFSLIAAYSFGKAQRLMTMLDPAIAPVLTHGAVAEVTATLRAQGLPLPPSTRVTPATDLAAMRGALVIAPPSALGSRWAARFGDAATAMASGWMAVRGIRRRRGTARGFVISDHADWDGLNAAIAATGAERVLATHGYTAPFAAWLQGKGLDAQALDTAFGGEDAADSGPEAGPDSGPEPEPETGSEPGPERRAERRPDLGPDSGPDSELDGGPEAGPNAGAQHGPEAAA